MSFFTTSDIQRKYNLKINTEQLSPKCEKCGLYKTCKTPRMEVAGEGRKRILILAEAPGKSEDFYGTPLVGDSGQFLKKKLRIRGISLNKDCWKANVVSCRPPGNATPTQQQIKCCHPNIEKIIRTLKPKTIFLLGGVAITSLFGEDFSNRKINRWRSYCIPDEKYKCNIIPLYHPAYLVRNEKDANLHAVYDRDLDRAIFLLKREYLPRENYEDRVSLLTDFQKVVQFLRYIKQEKLTIAFDYETTGLKPFKRGHKLCVIGIATSEKEAVAFPFDYKSFWTSKELNQIKSLWHDILKDRNIRKICHNVKFEDNWSAIKVGTQISRVHWDSMIGEHILDNRKAGCGLKFLTFVHFGVRPYDKHIAPYLRSTGEFNRVEKAPFKDLLIYCGLDCIFTYMHYHRQYKKLKGMKGLNRAYKFFMRSSQTLSHVQLNGMCINKDYYDEKQKELQKEIDSIEHKLVTGREGRKFKQKYGREICTTSSDDLGKLFYEILGQTKRQTDKGNYKTDKTTLESLNLPFVEKLLLKRKLEKLSGTYIAQFKREVVSSTLKMHPFFNLHIPVSFRSCIAGYEKVLVMRDFESAPEGVPIKDIKVGDYVYCFDDNLQPAIRRVLWQGKTDHREIIRVHYYRNGKRGHFDCTPEHKVRLINGEYVEAQNLLKYQHYVKPHNKSPRCHVLACSRHGDKLNFTGHLVNNQGILEHRFIYENFFGKIEKDKVIHHKNKNHLDHSLDNLQKMSKSEHARLHAKDTILTQKSRQNNIKAVQQGWKNGKYIPKGRLEKLSKLGRSKVQKILGHNYYKLLKLYDFYNIKKTRRWANQFGEFLPGNHVITKVEWLNRSEDVYDIEVEEYHNFFVNEICVHNSSAAPNFQNLPKRDEESKKIIRRGIVPSPDSILIEADFEGAEVTTALFYNKDKNFHRYLTDPNSDMHADCAKSLFLLPSNFFDYSQYTKEQKKKAKMIRFYAKNNWTFAQFYGDWFGSCGPVLWENCIESGLELPSGQTVKDWLADKGIYELGEIDHGTITPGSFLEHLAEVQEKMWGEMFPEYSQWKKDIVQFYREYGYIETYLGFRFVGYMTNNQCTNYPIQGTSFHLLLSTLNNFYRFLHRNKFKAKIIGQIHDSIVIDCPKDEVKDIVTGLNKIVAGLYDKYDWVMLPMRIDVEGSKSREEGGSFADMDEEYLSEYLI